MKKAHSILLAFALVVASPVMPAQEEEEAESPEWKSTKAEYKRQKIDEVAKEAMHAVFEKNDKAKDLYESAYGYAVFDNIEIAFGLSGGGGTGVAVTRENGARTYMKMGTVGIGIGLGGQRYQVVFLLQDQKTFQNFVDRGWQAEAAAKAAAGTAGANVKTGFVNGMAIYQMTDKGLIANADVSGTKYWKYKKLNKESP